MAAHSDTHRILTGKSAAPFTEMTWTPVAVPVNARILSALAGGTAL
jgi:hypothetical protein